MKRIPLTNGMSTMVDDCDYASLACFTWYATPIQKGCCPIYASAVINKRNVRMHRLITKAPRSKVVDHQNKNGLDNRRSNLRVCSIVQNNMNSESRGGTSRFKGVYWDKSRRKWRAGIGFRNKTLPLGRFDDDCDAATAYNVAAQILYDDFAWLNKV